MIVSLSNWTTQYSLFAFIFLLFGIRYLNIFNLYFVKFYFNKNIFYHIFCNNNQKI
uniref:Uncharacterized protein n=1 Tax=Solanum lycopersicum TaxID=4081 RepID=A0A3Q7FN82_SOLLC